MEEVERQLAMTRLLTLTGVGGSGKTRLAVEVARDLLEAYPDGVWLVELAPLSEDVLVPKAMAEALGVPERPAEPLAETLAEVLRDRQLLLILDNCEHLLEATSRLVDKLLDSCRHLRIMATSREAIGVEGEVRWLVPPLSVPEQGRTPSSEELEGYESVRLFVERARGRDPSFSLSPKYALAVTEICRRLEGIPLAIELAAARVGTLSIEQISQRLEGSLELLTRGGRTAVPRQRTLKGTLDWSHELLSEPERVLFRRLSIFAGGWTLEASEVVASGEGVAEREVLDLLSGLVEKSLVVAKESDEGGVRYRLLEPIRQYAREKLEKSGRAGAARRRHAEFFLTLAEAGDLGLWGPDQHRWLERLKPDHDNMRAALSWASERGDVELSLQLAGSLRRFWQAQGHYSEGRGWLVEALAKDDGGSSASARAKALEALARLAGELDDLDQKENAAQKGLALSTASGIAGSLVASFRDHVGDVAGIRGDYARARKLYEESLRAYRKAGDKRGMAEAIGRLGNVSLFRGDYKRAKELYQEALGLSRELGGADPLGGFLMNLGYVSLLEGDHERAIALNEEAVTLFSAQGQIHYLPVALDNLGWAALLSGDRERAEGFFTRTLELGEELGAKSTVAESLEGMACAAAAKGQTARSAHLFGAARTLQNATVYQQALEERALREPYLTAARAQLDEAAWEAAFAEGQAMTFEEAVAYALSAEEPSVTTLPYTTTSQSSLSSAPERPARLTPREIEVLGLVAAGMTNAQIAKELFVSIRTVETHITSIYHKLGVTSRAAATRFALEHGLA
jgi:predicted ATPase/DNA-binding CsgD family transcriptional regulator